MLLQRKLGPICYFSPPKWLDFFAQILHEFLFPIFFPLSFFPFWKEPATWNALWGYASQEIGRQLVFSRPTIRAGFTFMLLKLKCVHESCGDPMKVQMWILGWDLRSYSSSTLSGVTWSGILNSSSLQGSTDKRYDKESVLSTQQATW